MARKSPHIIPRGLTKRHAADYLGVSQTYFDKLLDAGTLQPPRVIGSVKRFDVRDLDDVFDALPYDQEEDDDDDGPNPLLSESLMS